MRTNAPTIAPTQTAEPEHPNTAANRAFGFWLYLMSDLVLFATIFATFAVVGHNYAGGPTGKDLFDLPYLFVETMFLLFSSAPTVWPSGHAPGEEGLGPDMARRHLPAGLGFISMEINEFHHMILDGNGPERSAFLSAFFTLVGTHGMHVTFGLIWMAVLMGQIVTKGLTTPVQSRLMRLSMFWHFLDIVWVGVFTIVYLMGVM